MNYISLEGSICLKYFRSAIIRGPLRNILEVHVHDNLLIFGKIFSKMFDYFRNFQKLNISKIFHYTVSHHSEKI